MVSVVTHEYDNAHKKIILSKSLGLMSKTDRAVPARPIRHTDSQPDRQAASFIEFAATCCDLFETRTAEGKLKAGASTNLYNDIERYRAISHERTIRFPAARAGRAGYDGAS